MQIRRRFFIHRLLAPKGHKVFEQFGACCSSTADLSGNGEPERLIVTLGIAPALSPAFTLAEDKADGAPVVILIHNLWRRRFGGDPHVIGQALTLWGKSRTFQFPGELDLWLPLALNATLEFGPGPVSVQRGQNPAASVIANAFLRQEILSGVLYSLLEVVNV